MKHLTVRARAALVFAVAVLTGAALLVATSDTTETPTPLTLTADTSLFDPGNIISDSMFFDPSALTYQQVVNFLSAKGAGCRGGSDGSPCLKDYRQTTFTRYANSLCPLTYYGAPNEDAADIIWRVAQVCNVSPKVLLVLLQKEQTLVTTTNPTARKYQIATGYGCPDTAPCDSQYYGLYNQLYLAAYQYQKYAANPNGYSYVAGTNNTIQWSPDSSCGTSVVYIKNKATAGLYDYTPYRPNAAALAAGYGTGDGCSAYGNRNFWLYFTDWFGTTQSPGGDAILAAYAAQGGSTGPLGAATSGIICGMASAGCGQNFQNGVLYWTAATGAHAVTGPYLSAWGWSRESGPLGYPVSDVSCGMRNSGCGQVFQGGRIYSTPTTGTHAIYGAIHTAWVAQGYEVGPLGYPTGDQVCGLANGGCKQDFEGGTIYSQASAGTNAISGDIASVWRTAGGEGGPLGYPVTGLICGMKDNGCGQVFQGGRIYSTAATGTHAMTGDIHSAWVAQGYEVGPLGYPTGDPFCGLANGGCKQDFQGGTIYSQIATGAFPVLTAYAAPYQAAGAEGGSLGYPVTGLICGMKSSGCGQVFQGGRIYSTPTTGAHAMTGKIHNAWVAQGYEVGPLGYPTGDQVCGLADGGCKQDFQGGTIYSQPSTGTFPVLTAYAAPYQAAGAEGGSLGYPVTGLICGMKDSGCGQVFQGGRIYSTPTTGAHAMSGDVHSVWVAQGYEVGPLGYPVTDLICGMKDSGCGQVFQGGRIYSTPTTGTHAITGAIHSAWVAQGYEVGPLGYPTGDQVCGLANGGCKQDFQGGTIYSQRSAGTFPVSGDIATTFRAAGSESGRLGYPITGLICGMKDSGCGQVFQGGRIYSTTATGAHSLSGAIENAWMAQGWENGPLGYPTSEPYAVSGGTAQDFQGGQLFLSQSTGQVVQR